MSITKISVCMLFLLIFSLGLSSVRAAGVDVWTSSSTYYVGDSVLVSFQAGYGTGVFGTAEITISGPGGSASAGTMSIETGRMYTQTLYGSALSFPGYYTVRVVVYVEFDIWDGQTSFQMIPRVPFDFALSITPATETIIKGATAKYLVSAKFSDESYIGTSISTSLTGLDPSMKTIFKDAGIAQDSLEIQTFSSTPPGTYVFTLTGTAHGISRQAVATLIVEAAFDYSITISPMTQTTNLGEKTVFTIVTNLVSGKPETVSLGLTGLPSDISYIFSPASGVPTFTSTLTIDLTGSTSTGTFTIPITASGGGLTKKADLSLTVREKDFNLAVNTNEISVKQGDTATVNLEIRPLGGFDQTVNLKATGLPSNATSKFSTSSGKPLFTSILTINLQLTTPEGSYPVIIEAEGGGFSHSATVTLKVEKKPFTLTISPNPEEGPSPTDSILLITAGQKPNIEGTLTPPYSGAKITLAYTSPAEKPLVEELFPFFEEKTGEGETIKQEVTVNSDGSFSDDFAAKSSGEWTVKATFQDGGKTLAESNVVHFTVKTYPIVLVVAIVAVIGLAAMAVLKSRKGKPSWSKGATKTVTACPRCGSPINPGDTFCGSCGENIQ